MLVATLGTLGSNWNSSTEGIRLRAQFIQGFPQASRALINGWGRVAMIQSRPAKSCRDLDAQKGGFPLDHFFSAPKKTWLDMLCLLLIPRVVLPSLLLVFLLPTSKLVPRKFLRASAPSAQQASLAPSPLLSGRGRAPRPCPRRSPSPGPSARAPLLGQKA